MKYFPNLKTTDSELRAIRHMSEKAKRNMMPVFELTRSRKTGRTPDGSLQRRAEQLVEAYSDSKFILDLCTEAGLMNEETINLFDEREGYANWRSFLEKNFNDQIIPCALYIEGGTKSNFLSQIEWIINKYRKVCIRTSVADDIASTLYKWTLEIAAENEVILCPILYYIDPTEYKKTKDACIYYIENVIGNRIPGLVIFAGSSFPRYVTNLPGCKDDSGQFDLNEIILEHDILESYPNLPIQKSDFASVHPRRYPTKGGTWVPRIDYTDGMQFRYSRVRLAEGGYAAAAERVDGKALSKLPKCWGTDQIVAAKRGIVNGRSPSFWISVRINCWITGRSS